MLVTSQRYYMLAATLVAVSVLSGCQAPPLTVAGEDATLPAGENSAAFLDRMSEQSTVTQNDALRGMLMLNGADKTKTFKQRVDLLIDRKIIPSGAYNASAKLSRGQLARMVCQTCELSGGVIMRMTGPSERYCLRELQYRQMMIPGSGATEISGMEFVSVLTRAAIYKQTGKFPNMVGQTE